MGLLYGSKRGAATLLGTRTAVGRSRESRVEYRRNKNGITNRSCAWQAFRDMRQLASAAAHDHSYSYAWV